MEQPGNQTRWSYLVARTKSQGPKNFLQSDTFPIQNFPRVIRANSRTKKEWNRVEHVTSISFHFCHSKHVQSCLLFAVMYTDMFVVVFVSFDGGQNICQPTYRVRVVMY